MTSELPAHLRAYQDVLFTALENLETRAVRDASPLDQLSRLAEQALPLVANEAAARATMLALGAVGTWPTVEAALGAADDLFGTPEKFGEAIYASRWLTTEPDNGLPLVQARRYLEDAVIPPQPTAMAELLTDRDATLNSTTFAATWRDRSIVAPALATIEVWRSRYVASYLPAHETHRRAMSTIADNIDDLALHALAIEKLNTLRRLGTPVGLAALAQFHELERFYACSVEDAGLRQTLSRAPACPECAFVLGAQAPAAEARRVRQAIERGLASQQRRLAQRVIARLLAQPHATEEERLARFVQVVQASDLNGLSMVLDDEMVEFLRQLLEPLQPEQGLIERLAASFPEVTLTNLDAAVEEMRRLLAADVVEAGGRLRLRSAGGV
ncbi:MAG TPA: hypothetical protein VJB57_20505 [Dehalococcoidia bacterium]|nr:hypothetical protein [Dehalococcoidia bacterium]